ncbi:hypothetical protein OSTOST_05718, partial [Ostertagia ostertagi]
IPSRTRLGLKVKDICSLSQSPLSAVIRKFKITIKDMEIALQEKSKGILYEGYTKSFRQCIFEEGDVVGKNERYEFRCDDDLECCGRTCCIPEATTIPLWLMIIFIILAAVLLLAILGTLAWLLAKRRKPKPKKAGFVNEASSQRATKGYSALQSQRHGAGGSGRDSDDRGLLAHEQETYSTPDHLYGGYGSRSYSHSDSHRGYPSRRDGYGNNMYHGDSGYGPGSGGLNIDRGGGGGGVTRDIAIRDARRDFARPHGDRSRDIGGSRITVSSDGLNIDRGGGGGGVTRDIAIRDARRDFARPHGDRSRDIGGSRITVSSDGNGSMVRHGVHETVEEKKFVPSPMQEESLPQPKEGHIVQRNEDEISRALTFDMNEVPPLNPQRAQLAFYRPFVADPMEEVVLPAPLRGSVSHHSIAELSQTQMPSY